MRSTDEICQDGWMKGKAAGPREDRRGAARKHQLVESIGAEIVRFQEESNRFDDLAARVLGLERDDLPCMTLLLYGGPASVDMMASALHAQRSAVAATVNRLQLAGYARRLPGDRRRFELTEHAREWIEQIWAPLREEGSRLMNGYSARDLAVMGAFMARAREVQERHARDIRQWLQRPASPASKPHLRGGLSPAALRRVQVFVEANLDRPIRLADLARRAGLSRYHFARAFRASAGVTPRAFVERCRVDRARQLINDPTRSLAAIAVEAGFGTQSRLTSTFKRHTGFTPGEYRRGLPAAEETSAASVRRAVNQAGT